MPASKPASTNPSTLRSRKQAAKKKKNATQRKYQAKLNEEAARANLNNRDTLPPISETSRGLQAPKPPAQRKNRPSLTKNMFNFVFSAKKKTPPSQPRPSRSLPSPSSSAATPSPSPGNVLRHRRSSSIGVKLTPQEEAHEEETTVMLQKSAAKEIAAVPGSPSGALPSSSAAATPSVLRSSSIGAMMTPQEEAFTLERLKKLNQLEEDNAAMLQKSAAKKTAVRNDILQLLQKDNMESQRLLKTQMDESTNLLKNQMDANNIRLAKDGEKYLEAMDKEEREVMERVSKQKREAIEIEHAIAMSTVKKPHNYVVAHEPSAAAMALGGTVLDFVEPAPAAAVPEVPPLTREVWTKAKLKKKKVPELKAIVKSMDVKPKTRKAELIAQILEHN